MKDLGSIVNDVNEIETRFIKSIMLYRHLTSDEKFELQELRSICSRLELGPEVQPLMTRITNLKRKNELIAKQEYERA